MKLKKADFARICLGFIRDDPFFRVNCVPLRVYHLQRFNQYRYTQKNNLPNLHRLILHTNVYP